MASDETEQASLSPDEFHGVLESLTDDEMNRLYAAAGIRALGTGWDGGDLLNEAIKRTLEGARQCPKATSVPKFLNNVMRSIAHSERERRFREPASGSGHEDGGLLNNHIDMCTSPLQHLELEQLVSSIKQLFDSDPEALNVVSELAVGWTPQEIMEICEIDATQYATIRRRIRRRIQKQVTYE